MVLARFAAPFSDSIADCLWRVYCVFGLIDGSLSFTQMFLVGWCLFGVFLHVNGTCCLSGGGENISTKTPQILGCNTNPGTI
jgi:hypothetical protein